MDTLQKIGDELVEVISDKVRNQIKNSMFDLTERLDRHATIIGAVNDDIAPMQNQIKCIETDEVELEQRVSAMHVYNNTVFDKLEARIHDLEHKLSGEQPDTTPVEQLIVNALINDYSVRERLRCMIEREIESSEGIVDTEQVREIISEYIENDDDLITTSSLEEAVRDVITNDINFEVRVS